MVKIKAVGKEDPPPLSGPAASHLAPQCRFPVFRVYGLGFGSLDLGSRVYGLGLRVQGLGLRV